LEKEEDHQTEYVYLLLPCYYGDDGILVKIKERREEGKNTLTRHTHTIGKK
jgi:hypothetical protein